MRRPVASDVSIAIDGQFDAPGDDNLNLNEEWVRLTNTGATTIDLSGWHVADESSSHRYQFSDLTPRARSVSHVVHRLRIRHGDGALLV